MSWSFAESHVEEAALAWLTELGYATATGIVGLTAGISFWGLHMGFSQGLLAALVADASPIDRLGNAFGFFSLVSGVVLLGWIPLRERPGPTVLTPHAGELARLLKTDSADVSAHRLSHARDAAERSGCVVLLKGDDTIVATPGGPVAISPGATAALATAGTGDVLSGVIGALLSKGLDAFEAAAAGTLIHARAGQVAAERLGADHTVAGDVIEALPEAMRRLRAREQ